MSTPTTAAIDRRIKRSAAGWSDLPDDLVGIVLSMMGASPRDRVCFAAVCRAWREAAPRHPVPAAAPMLLMSPLQPARGGTRHLCGPAGSWAFRVPSKLAANKRFVGSHDGGWVAAVDDHELVIVNLFSGHQVPLSPQQSEVSSIGSPSRFWFLHHNNCKIIFSGDPASADGCILAALTNGMVHITRCGAGRLDGVWSTHRWPSDSSIRDIAFCNGQLYGLTYPNEAVIKFGIGMRKNGVAAFTTVHRLAIRRRKGPSCYNGRESYASHIVELHGTLSIVVRTRWSPNLDFFFKVFKLVHVGASEAYRHKWVEARNFGDYAIFVGPTWSKAVHVPVGIERRGLERNHIYYSKYTHSRAKECPRDVLYSVTLNCGDDIDMYCKEDQNIVDGVGRTGYYAREGWNHAMWLYPPLV